MDDHDPMWMLLMLVLVAGLVPLAAAHPFTLDSIPPERSNAPPGTDRIIVFYSEALEEEFSTLKVFDSSGNQVDNRDTAYYNGEESLVVTTAPLEEGIYTVTSKVLSRVDGHLVPDAFVFGVGDVTIRDISTTPADLIYYPEAASRFPGIVGQTIILGAAIAAIAIWNADRIRCRPDELQHIRATFHSRFLWVTGIGIIAVFASNVAMIIIHSIRLEAGLYESLQTTFGGLLIIRMGVTAALLASWIILDRKRGSRLSYVPILAISLVLISTTTMIGHGAASGELLPVILDYIHNLVAAAWIGGVVFFTFVMVPALSRLGNTMGTGILGIMPRFSIMAAILIGIVIITGPVLMWTLEDNVTSIMESTYGMLIIIKIAIALAMVGMGAHHQVLQGRAERSPGHVMPAGLGRSLKVESVLGIALLGVVALLVNGTLPAGEVQAADAGIAGYGMHGTYWTESAIFEVDIFPFAPGTNDIMISVTGHDGGQLGDLESVKIKASNPQKGITPIQTDATETGDGTYAGQATFGFSDIWALEIEAQRGQSVNESILLNLHVKPRLHDLNVDVTEYEMPIPSKPLVPVYDGRGSIWISDMANPIIWRFSIDMQEFESFEFEGGASQALDITDDGTIWFADISQESIGYLDPDTGVIHTIGLPEVFPINMPTTPISIEADAGHVWVTIITKGVILRYDIQEQEFEQFMLDQNSAPFEVASDGRGSIWYSESATGKIGRISADTGVITPVVTDLVIEGPEAFLFDYMGNLWITEHNVAGIVRYDVALDTFEQIPVDTPDSLPFGMALDRYGNIWFAQHQIDMLGVLDPHNGGMTDIPIPTRTSFVQHITADGRGNIWFAEAEGGKLGVAVITEDISSIPDKRPAAIPALRYADVASPLMAGGIIVAALFFVKSVNDRRRIDAMQSRMPDP